ncbi:MAG: hypothetical protein A2351_01315 [Omnitrophica bacterium RIFOXYB12_FULL_50_7]|nr:MAG: hypothetical protein A2351_01315 [Omnitrophica bacterium RIFOXYB12_FULL_50_7]
MMKEYIDGLEKMIKEETERLNLFNRCERKGITGVDFEMLRQRSEENRSLYQKLKKHAETSV